MANRKPVAQKNGSQPEEVFAHQIKLAGLPQPEREARIIPGRRYKHDFVWDVYRLAVEIQGATWVKGAHSTGSGIKRDVTKQSLAAIEGYYTMAFTSDMVHNGQALKLMQAFFEKHNPKG